MKKMVWKRFGHVSQKMEINTNIFTTLYTFLEIHSNYCRPIASRLEIKKAIGSKPYKKII